jgi:hypothetical protein
MRTPFMFGRYDPAQNLTRAVVTEDRTPQVIPGPWRMVALVRGDEPRGEDAPSAPRVPGGRAEGVERP